MRGGPNNPKRHTQINTTERLRSAKSGLPVNVQAGPVRVGLLEIKPWLQRWVLRIGSLGSLQGSALDQ